MAKYLSVQSAAAAAATYFRPLLLLSRSFHISGSRHQKLARIAPKESYILGEGAKLDYTQVGAGWDGRFPTDSVVLLTYPIIKNVFFFLWIFIFYICGYFFLFL